MHEMSLVRSLLAQADEIAAAEGGTLKTVRVQLGPLSGVEGTLMLSAWRSKSSAPRTPARAASCAALITSRPSRL